MSLTASTANRKDINTAARGVSLEHRHFSFIAATIAEMDDAFGFRANVAVHFADACRSTNARFNRVRFLKACNVPSDL